jgi:hypothetical protein
VFDKTGCLKEDADATAIAFLRQIFCLGKKVEVKCSPARLKAAVEEYHAIERELPEPTLGWAYDEFDPSNKLRTVHLRDSLVPDLPLFQWGNIPTEGKADPRLGYLLDKCQRVADLITREFGFFEPVTLTGKWESQNRGTGFRHGPGAVADRRGLVNKYEFPRWSAKLEEWFPYRDCGTVAHDTETKPKNHEVASRLISVPKTAKSPRLIAAEPTEHQWCQQVLLRFMVERLDELFGKTFVCFKDQSLSADLALRASADRKLATIDLSSASDRLSCFVVERMLRANPSLLHAIHASRTRYIKDDILGGTPRYIKLRKFASQGTAVTFPVQSLCFLIVALAVSCKGQPSWSKIAELGRRDQVRVFGDDIIVPTRAYADVTLVLTHLGLKVNMEKSFHAGFFREACGMDAWKGHDVTPVKPRCVTPDGPQSRVAVLDNSNNLFLKGYWNAAQVTESALGSRMLRRLPILGRDCGLTGRISNCGTKVDHLDKRWNANVHRWEYRVYATRTRQERVSFGERFPLLQFFTEAPTGQYDWLSGIGRRAKTSDGLGWDPLYT